MERLMREIERVKELMTECNVTHLEINKYQHWKDKDSDEVVDKFETSIHQDDHNKPWRCTRDYAGYRRG